MIHFVRVSYSYVKTNFGRSDSRPHLFIMPHAQLFLGTYEAVLPHLGASFSVSDPDVVLHTVFQLKVLEARRIAEEAYRKPAYSAMRTIVVAFTRATREAQNALLKALEDPAPTTRFILIVPQVEALLPTVRSRLTIMHDASRGVTHPDGTEFIALSLRERTLRITKEFAIAKKSPEEKERVARWANNVLDAIEVAIHTKKDVEALRDLVLVRSYWAQPGASQKMLLEHLMLV